MSTKRNALTALGLLASLTLSACFDPTFREGLACSELFNCPPEQFCDLASQRCVSTVEGDLARPELLSAFMSTTGWRDENGQPIRLEFAQPTIGAILECRTGPSSLIGMLPYSPCDGATGALPSHTPVADPGFPEGSYETQARARIGNEVSPLLIYPFYAHRSLDSTPVCTSSFTDEEAFAVAANSLQRTTPFPNDTLTQNPFIDIPFKNVTISQGMIVGSGWSESIDDYRVGTLSLRRRFSLNGDRDLLLVQRQYESRQARMFGAIHSCENGFRFGNNGGLGPQKQRFDCVFFVLNSRGQSICLVEDNGVLVPGPMSETGWVKLTQKRNFSAKGAQDCPDCVPWYLLLPP